MLTKSLRTQDINEAILAGQLDFTVGLKEVVGICDAIHPENTDPHEAVLLKGLNVLVNEQTGKPIGETANVIVGNRYTPIQNFEGFGLVEGLAAHGGVIKEVRSWDGGKYSDMTVQFDAFEDPTGHQINKEITIKVPHDGKSSIIAAIWCWRLVCSNGMMGWKKDSIVRIRHTRSYQDKLQQARDVLALAHQHYEIFQTNIDKLHGARRRSPAQVMELLETLIPDNKDAKRNTRTQNMREDIYGLYMFGAGNKGESLYDLYNGIVDYVDHQRDTDNAAISAMYGAGLKKKQEAMELLLEVA